MVQRVVDGRRHRGIALGEVASETRWRTSAIRRRRCRRLAAPRPLVGRRLRRRRTARGRRSRRPLPSASWRPDRDPARAGPHPRRPRRRHDAPVAGVPHHRQRRQHPVADGGNRLAGDRPAARHHHQGHRSVGRLDAGPRLGARRPRLPQRQRRRGGHRRDARHRSGGRASSTAPDTCGAGCRIRSSSRWRR